MTKFYTLVTHSIIHKSGKFFSPFDSHLITVRAHYDNMTTYIMTVLSPAALWPK